MKGRIAPLPKHIKLLFINQNQCFKLQTFGSFHFHYKLSGKKYIKIENRRIHHFSCFIINVNNQSYHEPLGTGSFNFDENNFRLNIENLNLVSLNTEFGKPYST